MTSHATDILPENFLLTKEYRRFEEFADSCAQYRYIGVCHGYPGVGKTFAAQYYSQWSACQGLNVRQHIKPLSSQELVALQSCKAVYYSASVSSTPKTVSEALDRHLREFGYFQDINLPKNSPRPICHLIIIDEADRLNYSCLEKIREMYDTKEIGIILIGMPGIEKRLMRYPQLYSRIGFSHPFRNLSEDEIRILYNGYWQQLQVENTIFQGTNAIEADSLQAIIRITGCNFRLAIRLFTQIKRILQINQLSTITKEAVEAARSCLLIGQ